jgi:hypothetical protein
MDLSLADVHSSLPAAELLRVQKTLKLILGVGPVTRDRSRQAIRQAYARLGQPSDALARLDCQEAFDRLLEAFGFLEVDPLDARLRGQLTRNPFIVWLDERRCTVCSEALDGLLGDPVYRKRNYALFALFRLAARERRAWARWLGLNEALSSSLSERERSLQLYRRLAEMRQNEQNEAPRIDNEPAYLDEVFPDDPNANPVAWYYRDVLPLYRCLMDAEQQLNAPAPAARMERRQRAAHIIADLKCGRLAVVEEPAAFGQRVRHRLVRTLEKSGAAIAAPPGGIVPETETGSKPERQEVLF